MNDFTVLFPPQQLLVVGHVHFSKLLLLVNFSIPGEYKVKLLSKQVISTLVMSAQQDKKRFHY